MNRLLEQLYASPSQLVFVLAVAVFLTEMLVMVILAKLEHVSPQAAVLLDSCILLLFILPSLYLLVLRPLSLQIQKRRRAEEALQAERDHLRKILGSMKDIVCIVGQDHHIEYTNAAMEAEFGSVGGRRCYEYFYCRNEPCRPCIAETVFNGGSIHAERYVATGKTYDVFATPLINSDGTISKLEICRDISDRKRDEELLRKSRDDLRKLSAYLEVAREEERKSVAREIHDELGQVLASMQLELSMVTAGLNKEQPHLVERTKSMARSIQDAVGTVQKICSDLRPLMLDDLGLPEALEWQARKVEKMSGIVCDIAVAINSDVPRNIATALFRIYQECLTNVVRHSGASHVEATLVEKRNCFVLTVHDDGRGIDVKDTLTPFSFGINGMRERAMIHKGQLRIGGRPGKGTAIIVRIPVPKEVSHGDC